MAQKHPAVTRIRAAKNRRLKSAATKKAKKDARQGAPATKKAPKKKDA